MSRILAFLACATLLVAANPLAAATDLPDPAAPPFAVALLGNESVLVTWIPPPDAPDHYAIHGDNGGELTLLGIVQPSQTNAEVSTGFLTYHVTAVTGEEGKSVMALLLNPECIRYNLTQTPPTVQIGECHRTSGTPNPEGPEGGSTDPEPDP